MFELGLIRGRKTFNFGFAVHILFGFSMFYIFKHFYCILFELGLMRAGELLIAKKWLKAISFVQLVIQGNTTQATTTMTMMLMLI